MNIWYNDSVIYSRPRAVVPTQSNCGKHAGPDPREWLYSDVVRFGITGRVREATEDSGVSYARQGYVFSSRRVTS